ncbi:MAG: hypothetical protein R3220_08415 [Balneolaceae bacterium]|nr:hypothetical protein [Balneolaceae bacterium]
MQWLKHITVDLIATIVVAIVVFFEETTVLLYVLYVYTLLMVLARAFTLFNQNFRSITKRKTESAPAWMYHVLYFLNVVFLAYGTYYVVAAGWIFIWGVATYVHGQQS